MRPLLFFALLVFSLSCNDTTKQEALTESGFTLITAPDPELAFENLQLYPIQAAQAFVASNERVADVQVLEEALSQPRFRITEKKPFGRFDDRGAVNSLTVPIKSGASVFLMAGDIVKGGRQDRVLGEDQVIAGKMITDIPVFCVEKGRWSYEEAELEPTVNDQQAMQDKKIVAFRGYYHVAPQSVRQQAAVERNQQGVWDKVGEITSAHHAYSSTQAFAGLEDAEGFTRQREAYLRFFAGKFDGREDVVGLVAVSGHRVIGADLFGHPQLFQKKYEALLHAYITDALTDGSRPAIEENELEEFSLEFVRAFNHGPACKWNGQFVHFAKF